MRTMLFAVLLAIVAAAPAAADAPDPRTAHVRPLTRESAALLADATARCPVVQALVDDLGRTDVVVYVTDSTNGASRLLPAYLTFVSAAAGTRYLLVQVDRWHVSPWDRIAWLAHELAHAMEIARAPEVQDAESLSRFYKRVGWQHHGRCFESAQAQATGTLARSQVAGSRR